MHTNHPIIAGHVEAFDEQPLGQGPLEPETAHPGIVTTYDPTPLTTRAYDWTATTADYDGASDSPTRHQIGYGASEAEAVADLQDLLDDEYAPLVVPEDGEREDLAFQRGNDWMESERLGDVYGVRSLFK